MLKDKVKQQQELTTEALKDLRKLRKEENEYTKEARELENRKYQSFKAFLKDKDYFRFKHLEQIGVKADVVIFLTAKNAGKTTEIYREMHRLIERGEKFIYGRIYKGELESAPDQFNNAPESPVVLLKSNDRYYFYKKEDILLWKATKAEERGEDEDEIDFIKEPTKAELSKAGFTYVGLGYTFMNSNTLGGMNYKGFTTIFFDEVLSYHPINRISDRVLHAWNASVSTIQRNKANIRIFMLGNLQNVKNHPILDFYGIDIDDDLRIIKRGEGECTILYVNAGGLYGGSFKNQKGSAKHGDIEHQTFLKYNKIIKPSPLIVNQEIFDNMEYKIAFALDFPPHVWYCHLRSGDEINCLHCGKLDISTVVDGEIWTDDPTVYNNYNSTIKRTTLQSMFNMVYRLYRCKELLFNSAQSMENYGILLKAYYDKYKWE